MTVDTDKLREEIESIQRQRERALSRVAEIDLTTASLADERRKVMEAVAGCEGVLNLLSRLVAGEYASSEG